MPGVESVAVSDFAPLSGGGAERRLVVDGESLTVGALGADDSYFSMMRIPIVAGRTLQIGASGEAVVNRLLWALLSARGVSLGDAVRLQDDGPNAGRLVIVGVVEDARHYAPEVPAVPMVYLPALHQTIAARRAVLLLRTTDRQAVRLEAVRGLVSDRLPDVPLWRLDWVEDRYASALRPARLALWSLPGGGLLTLGLAMSGILALLHYIVSRSRRERGIRAALGASPARAYFAVASGVVGAACAGLLIGGGVGWLGSHRVLGHPDGADAFEVSIALVATAVLISISMLVPAIRTRRWGPAQLMRED